MKKLKRIVSFVMAMVIFASFFCYNAGAVATIYVLYEYGDTFAHERFSDTSAYAFASIRDWAEEENTTDLRASTYAHVEDYEYLDNFYDAETYVELIVWLEDGSEVCIFDRGYVEPDGGTIDAFVRGKDCLNDENHYSIVNFDSWHEVIVYFRYYTINYDDFNDFAKNDGPIIEIYSAN